MSFKEFALNESPQERKGIFFSDGKKVEGYREGKMVLGKVQNSLIDDGPQTIEFMTWPEYKKSNLPVSHTKGVENLFITALLKQLDMKSGMDFQMWKKRTGDNSTFEEKVDYLMDLGAQYTKAGLKS